MVNSCKGESLAVEPCRVSPMKDVQLIRGRGPFALYLFLSVVPLVGHLVVDINPVVQRFVRVHRVDNHGPGSFHKAGYRGECEDAARLKRDALSVVTILLDSGAEMRWVGEVYAAKGVEPAWKSSPFE